MNKALKVSQFRNVFLVFPILPKTNLKTQIFALAYWGRNFSFVFWENWKNQNPLSKLTDLSNRHKGRFNSVFPHFFESHSDLLKHCLLLSSLTLPHCLSRKKYTLYYMYKNIPTPRRQCFLWCCNKKVFFVCTIKRFAKHYIDTLFGNVWPNN